MTSSQPDLPILDPDGPQELLSRRHKMLSDVRANTAPARTPDDAQRRDHTLADALRR